MTANQVKFKKTTFNSRASSFLFSKLNVGLSKILGNFIFLFKYYATL